MNLLLLVLSLFSVSVAFAGDAMDKIRSLRSSHPDFPDAIVELQAQMLKERKWENTLGIAHVFRTGFADQRSTFRADPYLMEAYALIQFCRFDEAGAVLDQAEFYAKKYELPLILTKIQKARELEGLSRLYRNTRPATIKQSSFRKNQIQWTVDPSNEEIFNVLDQVIIRPESRCRS